LLKLRSKISPEVFGPVAYPDILAVRWRLFSEIPDGQNPVRFLPEESVQNCVPAYGDEEVLNPAYSE
jgi:hypothetical protein